jgi:hypothetical protein
MVAAQMKEVLLRAQAMRAPTRPDNEWYIEAVFSMLQDRHNHSTHPLLY